MARPVDRDKVVRQHLEIEGFFTGFVTTGPRGSEPIQSKLSGTTSEVTTGTGAGSTPPRLAQRPVPSPAEAAQAGAALEKIAAEVNQCCKCGLGSSRTHGVPGEGDPKARIMFIGEAPGADEDAQGRPFVGRAGQLLDKIIAACGLKREDVFIANILKCRPPDNRDPRPEEIISCLPYLQSQIEIIEPEVIVALGAHAARTLLDTNKAIGQLRGQFHEYYSGIGRPPIKLMATFHPAYLLRAYSPENRRKVWEDMKRVLAELNLPVPE